MKKLCLIFIFNILILFSCTNLYAAGNIPENVRIGLCYSGSAVSKVSLSSDTGFDVGYVSGEAYTSIFKDKALKNISINKDNYNLEVSNAYAYHIQIGEKCSDYADAKELAAVFKSAGYNAYPTYNGAMKVWIGVYNSTINANLGVAKIKKSFPGYTYTVVGPKSKSIQVISDNKICIMFASEGSNLQVCPILSESCTNVCSINGTAYRGNVRIIRQSGSDMTVINVVNLEQYLYSVVASEMSSGWPIEALKAQSVAARTFAVRTLLGGGNNCTPLGFDMNNTTEFQAYKGYGKEGPSCIQAVEETKGIVAYYDGAPISAVYFSSDGGHTENSENVWVSVVPYLRGVEDKYQPPETTNQNWSNSATPVQIKQYLASKGVDIGDITDVRVDTYSEAGNALNLKIIGTKGIQEYKKDNIRMFMRYFNGGGEFLLSQTFIITKPGSSSSLTAINGKLSKQAIALRNIRMRTKSGITSNGTSSAYIKSASSTKPYTASSSGTNSYVFNGKGWGHEVGMSQYGARGMAQQGFTYDQILKHYYTGIELK